MVEFKTITHVIYDLDGLLLGTESINEQVNQQIVQRYGKVFDKNIKMKIAGRNAQQSAQIIIDSLEIPLTISEYIAERKKIIYQLYPQAQPLPGALELTKHLHQNHIPQAIASSSSQVPFQLKTTNYQEWFRIFHCIVLGDDPAVKNSKPAPDIFLTAAERLGALPHQCLVFEDSLAGMEAALSAHMSVIVIPDADVDKSLYFQAHQILNSLLDFQPQLWGLPSRTKESEN